MFLLIFGLFLISPSAEETVFEAVYYGYNNNPDTGYFIDMKDAIAGVRDNGVIYINGHLDIYETINIDKSIELISLAPNYYEIKIFGGRTAFKLNSTDYLK